MSGFYDSVEKVPFTAKDIAKYLLYLSKEDNLNVTDVTNLKIQKLLYFGYGHYLALYGTPLFSEKIEAWKYGPVVRERYDKYKKYGDSPIKFPMKIDLSIYSEKSKDFLGKLLKKYRTVEAYDLVDMTHQPGFPWKNAYKKGRNTIIPDDEMFEHFKSLSLLEELKLDYGDSKKRKLSSEENEFEDTASRAKQKMKIDFLGQTTSNKQEEEDKLNHFPSIQKQRGVDTAAILSSLSITPSETLSLNSSSSSSSSTTLSHREIIIESGDSFVSKEETKKSDLRTEVMLDPLPATNLASSMPPSLYDKDKKGEDILDYHHKESELRVITRPIKLLMKTWYKREKEKEGFAPLEAACRDFSEGDYSKIPLSFPPYISKLLIRPRDTFPSLHKAISDEIIKKIVNDALKEVLEELRDEQMKSTAEV